MRELRKYLYFRTLIKAFKWGDLVHAGNTQAL